MRRLHVAAEPAFRTRHANPYNARLYLSMPAEEVSVEDLRYVRLLTRRTDIVHLHWPDLTFLSGGKRWLTAARLTLFSAALGIARWRGTRVVWTAHNLIAHEERSTPRLRAWYRRMLVRDLDAIICLSEDGARSLRDTHPDLSGVPVSVIPHGHYRDDYAFGVGRDDARRTLGVAEGEVVVVSLGQIRPYKNLPQLIETFRALPDADRALRLVLAGRPADDALRAELERARAGDDRVILEFGHVTDERMVLWLAASDLAALPYRRIDNSGSAILALSAGRSVLAPRLGGLPELAAQVGEEWLLLYDGELTVETLARAVDQARTRPADATPDLAPLDWAPIAQQTLAVYRAALAAPRVRSNPDLPPSPTLRDGAAMHTSSRFALRS